MWIVIVIVLIVIFIIGKFLYDRSKQRQKIAMEGGIRHKYSDLIEMIMSGESRSKIYQETPESITIGISNLGGTTLVILTQTFGKISVQWKVDSPVFGKHKLEWDFHEYGNQEKMAERMANDVKEEQRSYLLKTGDPRWKCV